MRCTCTKHTRNRWVASNPEEVGRKPIEVAKPSLPKQVPTISPPLYSPKAAQPAQGVPKTRGVKPLRAQLVPLTEEPIMPPPPPVPPVAPQPDPDYMVNEVKHLPRPKPPPPSFPAASSAAPGGPPQDRLAGLPPAPKFPPPPPAARVVPNGGPKH